MSDPATAASPGANAPAEAVPETAPASVERMGGDPSLKKPKKRIKTKRKAVDLAGATDAEVEAAIHRKNKKKKKHKDKDKVRFSC